MSEIQAWYSVYCTKYVRTEWISLWFHMQGRKKPACPSILGHSWAITWVKWTQVSGDDDDFTNVHDAKCREKLFRNTEKSGSNYTRFLTSVIYSAHALQAHAERDLKSESEEMRIYILRYNAIEDHAAFEGQFIMRVKCKVLLFTANFYVERLIMQLQGTPYYYY